MILSKATSYGIRALVYLAKQPKSQRCGLKEIAEAEKIPALYLGKLLNVLRRHRLVHSTKGIHGGYALACPPEAISLLAIFSVLDTHPNLDECFLDCVPCHSETTCPLHKEWQEFQQQFVHMLEHRTIAQLAAKPFVQTLP